MNLAPQRLMAWLGPGISVRAYEVGGELRDEILVQYPGLANVFASRAERLYADLYAMARQILSEAGVTDISGGDFCTYTDKERFFSHRRDGVTGRMASSVWLA